MPDRPDDPQDLSGTQPVRPPTPPPYQPPRVPTPASGHVQQPSQRYDGRKRKNDRRNSALYFPAWSVGLMLLLVFGIVGAMVMLVITLGGQSAPGGQPQIVIITANPTDTPEANPTPTPAGLQPLPSFQGPLPTFALAGPTLPPAPTLSPTPIEITLGATVIVNVDGLNVRSSPGLDQSIVTNANKGDRFTVVAGPQAADSLTWWQIQDPADPTRKGWAAADYLDVAVQ